MTEMLWAILAINVLTILISGLTIFRALRHRRRVMKYLALMDLKKKAIADDFELGRADGRETAERYFALSVEIAKAYEIKY